MKITWREKGNTKIAAEFIQKAVGGELFTFLEHYDWTDKRIIPFCTNEGSGDSVRDIKKICKGADVDSGASFTGSQVSGSKTKIAEWAKGQL